MLGDGGGRKVAVSLVAVAKNEAASTRQWLGALLSGSRLPDEIILVDGGSTDGTLEVLHSLAADSRIPVKILSQPGANIATSRNLAIQQAQHPIIAVTDFGCRPRSDWLKNLIMPFELDPAMQVVAGAYQAVDQHGNPITRRRWQDIEQIQPQEYLPSSRSIAFTKVGWQEVGGYPEWLTLTGEDTCFALELKRTTRCWAFVPEAVVEWQAPVGTLSYWRKQRYWSLGDGEVGMSAAYYRGLAQRYGLALLTVILGGGLLITCAIIGAWLPLAVVIITLALLSVWVWLKLRTSGLQASEAILEVGGQLAQLVGYLDGARNRARVDQRRWASLKGIFFILAVVPLDDTGGGARSAQIARELIHQGWLVVYLNKYPSYESVDLKLQINHPNLIRTHFSRFSLSHFFRRVTPALLQKKMGVLIELPDKQFAPLIRRLHEAGATVIYDLLDDWSTSLGARWYSEQIELEIIRDADHLMATAPVLAERMATHSGRKVHLLPNAVNLRLFDVNRAYPRPGDLPQAERIILYAGALWGEWFDWQLLMRVSESYPQACVVVIGDYRGQLPRRPRNLHFLGLKPQHSLPAYLAYTDVAIIPWKVNTITLATSPLKIYEYLAMRKPVVAPALPILADLPFTLLSVDDAEFIRNIERAFSLFVGGPELDMFLRENSWQRRVEQLLHLLPNQSHPV